MRRVPLVLGLALAAVVLIALPSAASPFVAEAQEDEAVVRAYLFYSQTCPSCHAVRRDVIPALYRRHGTQLRIRAIDVTVHEANYRWLEACREGYGVAEDEADVPVVFIGDTYLIGSDIQEQLPDLVQKYMEEGGVDWPDVPPPADAPESTARFAFFFRPTCPHCKEVEENVFPQIVAKYGDRVQWEAYDTSDEVNLRALIGLGQVFGVPEDSLGAVPVVFMGDEYTMYSLLLGGVQIPTYLESRLEWYLDVGGVSLPEWMDQLFELAETPFPTVTPESTSTGPRAPEVHLAYFSEPGCSECSRVANILGVLQERYPNLVVHEYDIVDDISLNLCLSERLGVPEDQRHDAPTVFVGTDYLVDRDIRLDPLIEILDRYAQSGAPPGWESCPEDSSALPALPPWGQVIVGGLVDGINPCAFATIIFFISYLTAIERKGRDIILVGLAFTLAVFVSYLAFGLFLRQVFTDLIGRVGVVLRLVLNVTMAVVCLVLAVLSASDFRKARKGKVKDISLRLPDRMRRWINATIRKGMHEPTLNRLVVASFISGVVVSFIELTCTGQGYVPIILMLSSPEQRGQAVIALVVYCLLFVVPLIAVFVAYYMGTSSRQLGTLLQRHAATVKLAMACVFFVMGIWLMYEALRIQLVAFPALL